MQERRNMGVRYCVCWGACTINDILPSFANNPSGMSICYFQLCKHLVIFQYFLLKPLFIRCLDFQFFQGVIARNLVHSNPCICRLCPNQFFCNYRCECPLWHLVKMICNRINNYKVVCSCICNLYL